MTCSFPQKISVLAFDLGNVLIRVDHMRFCRRLAELAGLDPGKVFQDVFESSLEPGYDTGSITSREFYQRLTAHFGVALPYPRFSDFWCDIFDPMEGMEEAVAHLAATFPLFLVSNTNPLHFHYIQERFHGLLRHFGAFILSYQVGSRKPEAEIYQALIRQAGHPPGEILFLDDKLAFVQAARDQGLKSWQFTTSQDLQQALREHYLWRN